MTRARLGLFFVSLGGINIVRLLPEILSRTFEGGDYWIIVGSDLVSGGLLLVGGMGLRAGRDWAPRLAAAAAGYLMTNSAAWGLVLAHVLLGQIDANLFPRFFFYILAVAFLPYGIWVLLHTSDGDSRKPVWEFLVGGTAMGPALLLIMYLRS